MSKVCSPVLGALLLSAVVPVWSSAEVPKARASEWITQKAIDRQGGYKVKVGTAGTFVVKRVRPVDKPQAACLVHVPTVRKLVSEGIRNRTLDFSTGATTVEFKVTRCPNGILRSEDDDGTGTGGDDDSSDSQLCCMGAGKGCVADVERLP
jgi:hypothetical protein